MVKCCLSLVLILFCPANAFSEAPPLPLPPDAKKSVDQRDFVLANSQLKPQLKDGKFKSLVPLVDYNPTYGIFGGVGYFHKLVEEGEERSSWGLVAVTSQHQHATKTEFKGQRKLNHFWRMEWRNELANGYEPNFGQGDETRAGDEVDVPLWKDELDLYFPYYISDRFAVGPGLEHRIRHSDRLYKPVDGLRQRDPYPDQEATAGLVLLERVDFRDIESNPSLGWTQELHLTFVNPYLGPIHNNFSMVNMDVTVFQYLIERDLVLAYHMGGGWIFGTPTYLNQFRLGGTDELRGYFYNRFRGSRYYLEQTELRFPILGAVSGATFGEFGEVTDSTYPLNRAHVSYGIGLRIGLPPDRVSKMRIDYAIGQDQRGVFVDFGQAF